MQLHEITSPFIVSLTAALAGALLAAGPASASVSFLNVIPSSYTVGKGKALWLQDYVEGTEGSGFNGAFNDLTYGFSDWFEGGFFTGTGGDFDEVTWAFKARPLPPQKTGGWTLTATVRNLGGGRPEYFLMGGREITDGGDLHLGIARRFGERAQTNAAAGYTQYVEDWDSDVYLDFRTRDGREETTASLGLYPRTEFGWVGMYYVEDSRPGADHLAAEVGFYLD